MRAKARAPQLESLIAEHPTLAAIAGRILADDALSTEDRAPVVAACRYGYEETDLVPDTFPAYGLVDDLFVLGEGLRRFLRGAGAGSAYAKEEVGGAPLEAYLEGMRSRFLGFWQYCSKQTKGYFEGVAASLADPAVLEETRARYEESLPTLRGATAGVTLEEGHVDQFLARFRSYDLSDLEE